MQKQNFLAAAGQEVQRSDLNNIAQTAAVADDIALSAFTRFAEPSGSNPVRAIIPAKRRGAGDNSVGTVSPATAGVTVNPFLALIGSRTSGSPQDIRSAQFAGDVLTIGAQTAGSGTVRIDLVYATVYVDQLMATVTRFQKNPTTGVNTPNNVSVQKRTYVVCAVQAGIASSTPALPTLPSDPAGGYNIPLAYVRVANGFGALSVTSALSISDISPSISLDGGARPASASNTAGSPLFDGKLRTKNFIGAGSIGKHDTFFFLDTSTSGLNGSTIDSSVDWRKRAMTIASQIGATAENSAWWSYSATALPAVGEATMSFANSFKGSDQTIYSYSNGSGSFALIVDGTTGVLKISVTGTPAVTAYFNISATAQFVNV